MKNLIDRNTLIILLMFYAIYLSSYFLPSRRTLLNLGGEGKNVLNYVDAIVILADLFINSFFYGWLTNSIVKNIKEGNVSLLESLTPIKSWFPKSLIVILIGWGGIIMSYLAFAIPSEFLSTFFTCIFGGIWITLTFTLYPTVIAIQKPILMTFIKAFSINIRSVNRWFHLLLFLFLISGGITFLWVPENVADKFWGINQDFNGWAVHFQWLGGYSFKSFWYKDLSKWLLQSQLSILEAFIMFVNILISTFVKIKVTRILFENGYFSEAHEISPKEIKKISNVEERYLKGIDSESLGFNLQNLKSEKPEYVYQKDIN